MIVKQLSICHRHQGRYVNVRHIETHIGLPIKEGGRYNFREMTQRKFVIKLLLKFIHAICIFLYINLIHQIVFIYTSWLASDKFYLCKIKPICITNVI
jgi:hypothetical protein